MKTSPVFSFCRIAGVPYLLPYGQGIADHMRGIRLNESGAFLWNKLQNNLPFDELLDAFVNYCEASPSERPMLKQDLEDFLQQLAGLHILAADKVPAAPEPLCPPAATSDILPPESGSVQASCRRDFFCQNNSARSSCRKNGFYKNSAEQCIRIGPLVIKLAGPAAAFCDEFAPYADNTKGPVDLTIALVPADGRLPEHGRLLIRNQELCVYEAADYYILQFPGMPWLYEALLAKDGSHASVSHIFPYTERFSADFFHVVRFLFLYTAALRNCFALHSASILYRQKAWLFSGHSGMGKSTHTNLWKDLCSVNILNGDLNLISLSDKTPVIYGTPWCGTSGIADPDTYPLGGIVLLNRGETDQCIELPLDQKILLTAQRLISPAWDAAMLQQNLDFMSGLVPHIRVCTLKCTKQPSAVKTIKQWIDRTSV